MMSFENSVPVKVIFGFGKLDTIGGHTKSCGKKALIVTTGSFFKENGLVDRIIGYLHAEGVDSEYYYAVSPNPHLEEAQAGADFARKTGCDVVIGLGGGSAIDAAKCIAVAVAQGNDIWSYWMGEKTIFAALPIIAVSTTSGTGSHITPYSVLTNPVTNEKPGAGSPFLFAKVAIVDPELMMTLPPKITAATGFDVLAHAIEAYTSIYATPFTELYCQKAISIVGKYLRKAMADGSDREAREMMALADTFSGYSIAIANITMCHAMGHSVGGVCNTVHGECLAAMTPSTMRHSMNSNPEKYKNIGAWLMGYETIPADWTPGKTVDAVEKLITDIGMNVPLSQQGVKRTDFDRIIAGTIGYMGGGCNNDPAAPISAEDVRKVLEGSF